MGWEEDHVARIIHRYVDRSAATRAIIAQPKLTANKSCKTACKIVHLNWC